MNQTNSNLIEIRPGRKLRIFHYSNFSDKTIFFIHGLGGRAEQFQAQIDFFKKDYNIVAADFLGHGQSEKPQQNAHDVYSFAEQYQDLQTIFDRYRTDKNYIIGHSYGGAFATYLTLQNPEKANKLVLIVPLSLQPNLNAAKIFYLPVFLLEWMRPLLTKAFAKMAFDPQTDPALVAREIAIGKLNPMYIIKAATLGLAKLPNVDITKILQPTLLITVANDGLVPPKQVTDFYQHLPNAQFAPVAGASHLVIMEQAGKVNELIKTFLQQ